MVEIYFIFVRFLIKFFVVYNMIKFSVRVDREMDKL